MPKLIATQHDADSLESLAAEIAESAEELRRIAKAMPAQGVKSLEVPFGFEEATKGVLRIRKFALAARDSLLELRKARGDFQAKRTRAKAT